jgi:GxxExxY protein
LRSIIKGYSDILVEGVLVIELKGVERLANEHMAQCLNYLRASGCSVCLLVNFQRPKTEWRRIVNGYQPAETAENEPNLPADHQ